MIRDIGVTFKFKGGPEAQSAMDGLRRKYGDLSGALAKTPTGGGFASLTSGAKGLGKAALGATAAVTGLVAAAAGAAYKLATSRKDLTNEQANLRALGLDDAAIKDIEARGSELSKRYAGITGSGFAAAAYDIQSAMSDLNAKQVADVTATSALMGRATKMSQDQATALMGSLYGASKHIFKNEAAEEFADKWAAGVYKTVQLFKTTGPQLASAAKNSVAILADSGWSREQMLGTWGSLITGGVSGEQAGTAMKQIALKSREGFAKTLLEASGLKVDTSKYEGPARKQAEAYNKALMDRFSQKGDALWQQGPEAYFRAIKQITDKLKGEGKDWKKILGGAFGEEPVNALVSLMGKLGGLGDMIKQVAGSSKDELLRINSEMNKGIGPQMAILSQLWSGLKSKLGSVFEPLVTGVMQRLGETFINVMGAIDGNFEKIKTSVQGFAGGAASAFMQAFAGVGNIQSSIKGIADALANPDPSKWSQMGAEFGKLAGVNLSALVSGLKEVAAATADIARVVGPVASGLASVMGAGRDAAGWISRNVGSRRGLSSWWNSQPSGFSSTGESVMRSYQRTPAAQLPIDSTRRGPEPVMAPGPLSSPSIGRTDWEQMWRQGPPPAAASAERPVDINQSIKLEVDGRVLAETVERYRHEDRNAAGVGYGEKWAK